MPLMKKNNQRGFTLIELLVVIVVLMSTGMVIGAILFSSLRGASKASILTTARQNGDYAISQMTKTIRNAQKFGGVKVNDLWETDCSINGGLIISSHIKITNPDNNETVYSCAYPNIKSNGVSLLDTSLVESPSCYFTCSQNSPSDSPTIGINFTLVEKQDVIALVENTVRLQFSTSVQIRNSNK